MVLDLPPAARPSLMSRSPAREPRPLDQLPVWHLDPSLTEDAPEVEPPAIGSLLDGLNVEQRRAVTHGDGPLLVVAGAGTGKTAVITRRIAWLIATKRAHPSEILALTFTDKAAEEMQVRVDQLVPYGYTDTAIATFHAFGDRIIRDFALEAGLPTDVRVLTRPEVVIFLREHLFELGLDEYRPLGDPTRFLGSLATLFSRAKDEDVSPAAYLAHAERLVAEAEAAVSVTKANESDGDAAAALAETARRQLELARAFGRYQELLGANGFVDFGDQVSLALRLVRESPAVRRTLQARFRYILVDEFQDTNRSQAELVAILAEPHRNVTVVGDDDQSIYKFRGAAISNILEFRARYRGARTVVLRRNYRSLQPILDAAYRLVRHNDPDRLEVRVGIAKRLRPERAIDMPAPVRLEAFASGAEEADWVASDIGRRIAAGGRPRDHAVLVRANAAADPVLRSLNLAGIPWRFSGTSGLYQRPEVRLLLAFLRAVADLSSSTDVYALATSDIYGLGGPDLTAIVNTARRRNRSLWEILDELGRQPGILRLAPGTRTAAARLVDDLRSYTELAHQRPAGEVLFAFLKGSGLLARYAAADTAAAEEAVQNVARFFDIIRGQSALLADDRVPFVASHLQTLIEAGDDPATADHDPDADAVAVLTVHKAKGLEFPVVFLIGLVAGRFPAADRTEPLPLPVELVRETLPSGDFALQEERRLFYVGMTRARDELVLTHAADYGGGRARRVSPFVLEALDLPAVGTGTPVQVAAAVDRLATFEATPPAARPRPDRGRRAAHPQLRRHRRLPHLSGQVPLLPRTPRPARAASRAGLRRRAPPGRPGVPQAPCSRRRDDRRGAGRGVRAGLGRGGLPVARPRGGPAGRRTGGASPVPGRAAGAGRGHPCVRRAGVQLQPRRRPDPGPLGQGRHRGLAGRTAEEAGPDVVVPDLTGQVDRGGSGRRARPGRRGGRREPDTAARPPGAGDDHRLQVERRPRPGSSAPASPGLAAAPDLRPRLRGPDRPTAGRGRAPLPRVGSGRSSGRRSRSASARRGERIRDAAAGIRRRDFAARPDYMACGYCAFREICPDSITR